MRGSRGLRMIGGAFFDGALCGWDVSGEKGQGEREEGLRWSAIPPIEITVRAWRATDIE